MRLLTTAPRCIGRAASSPRTVVNGVLSLLSIFSVTFTSILNYWCLQTTLNSGLRYLVLMTVLHFNRICTASLNGRSNGFCITDVFADNSKLWTTISGVNDSTLEYDIWCSWQYSGIWYLVLMTVLWTTISGVDDSTTLQQDLHNLTQWSNEWLLRCNPEKSKVMHIGHSHQIMCQMSENGVTRCLQTICEEKDLVVFVADILKPCHQYSKAIAKAMSILSMIHRGFGQVDMLELKILYNTYGRPRLEFRPGQHNCISTAKVWLDFHDCFHDISWC